MPKIIEGAREKILENAKQRLFENGYQHLSLREVAKESGIATGTIYNYFTNKDYLIANIMLEDWETAVQKMDQRCSSAGTVKEGVLGICQAMDEFCDIYLSIWLQPSVAAAASADMEHRHQFLVGQIKQKVECLIEKKGFGDKQQFTTLIAEMILASAGKSDVRVQLAELVEQLYP